MRFVVVLPLVLLVSALPACSSSKTDEDLGAANDTDGPVALPDGATARPDLAAPTGDDLAVPDDLAAPAGDLAGADLAMPDLATRDLANPPPDLAPTFKQRCFPTLGANSPAPDYDQFKPKYASTHCNGTNAQDIRGVEKVVFIGDSITVGSPPGDPAKFYRVQLADALAVKFGLSRGNFLDWEGWKNPDLINGVTSRKSAGDFWSCAKWGARMDDLIGQGGNDQIAQCFGGKPEPKKTLVVLTMSGNDLNSWAQDGTMGKPIAEILLEVDKAIAYLDRALAYVKDPKNFPNGAYAVIANTYEFTDATGDIGACPVAGIIGLGSGWPGADQVFIKFNEEIVRTAVKYDVDVVFMMEAFCGHGFKRDDPKSVCYRGPGAEMWFDLTCIHPSNEGHVALGKLFQSVINE